MKKTLFLLAALILTFNVGICQTYVSGGIYSNTTWTQANSPYIVTGTVVVFPNVTLAIEPGVEVRFDNSTYLEIRHGILNAIGNYPDSIIFTSNSAAPFSGIWEGIGFRDSSVININYCIFKYSTTALNPVFVPYAPYTVIKNSSFFYNETAIGEHIPSCIIDSCSFISNQSGINSYIKVANCFFLNNTYGINLCFGIDPGSIKNCTFCSNYIGCYDADTLINCIFSQNQIGLISQFRYLKNNIFMENDTALYCSINSTDSMVGNSIYNNQIGILLDYNYSTTTVFNNNICKNLLYNVKYTQAPNNVLSNNCWCETDSSAIADLIYDGYDNVSLGLIDFTPYIICDSTALPDTTISCSSLPTEINYIPSDHIVPKIYPNPFENYATFEFYNPNKETHHLLIYNVFGQLVLSIYNITTKQAKIERGNLTDGFYFFQLQTNRQVIATGKFIIE